jgi:7,8-dihydroneopterin aldolase/epimerase/oxygenase
MAVTRIFIRNLELLARIGIHGHEQGMPQPVRINVDLEAQASPREDSVEEVVDYETIANGIRAIISDGHINLAETLAERIAAMCLADSRVSKARIKVEKLHALQNAEAAGVEIERP